MKWSLLALVVGTAAQLQQPPLREREQSPARRDIATASAAITEIGKSLAALDVAVKDFSASDPRTLDSLVSATMQFQSAIRSGTNQIQASEPLSINDAVSLQGSLQPLEESGNNLVKDLADKKPEVQKANLCAMLRSQIQTQIEDVKALISTTISKIPQSVQAVAQQFTTGFTDSLDSVQKMYAEGNCTDSGGNGASATGGASSSRTGGSGSNGTVPSRAPPTTLPTALPKPSSTPSNSKPSSAAAIMNFAAAPVGALAIAMAAALM